MEYIKDFTKADTISKLSKALLFFTIPLMFTDLLQVFFNMADVIVVGKFAGDNALGSVGSTSMLCFFCNGLLWGIGAAVNVIVAFYIGANKTKDISETVGSSFLICIFFGVLISACGVVFAKPVLVALNTKQDLLDEAVVYFRIFSLSLPFQSIYNYGNGVLSAHGDTRSPFIYLTAAGILNIFLNIIFVVCFKMSVAGVAIATVIAQCLSAVLVCMKLIFRQDEFALRKKYIRFNNEKIIQLLKIGLPAGLQNAIFAFANMFIQKGVNTFESAFVIGNSAAGNADPIVYSVMGAFYAAGATSIGQNFGAKNKKQIASSYLISVGMAMASGIFLGMLLLVFGRQFMHIFTNDNSVAEFGYQRLMVMSLSYWIAPLMDGSIAASRGLGKTFVPTIIVIIGSCVFRIAWIYTVFAHFGTVLSLFSLFPCSWIITAVAEIFYFLFLYRKVEDKNC